MVRLVSTGKLAISRRSKVRIGVRTLQSPGKSSDSEPWWSTSIIRSILNRIELVAFGWTSFIVVMVALKVSIFVHAQPNSVIAVAKGLNFIAVAFGMFIWIVSTGLIAVNVVLGEVLYGKGYRLRMRLLVYVSSILVSAAVLPVAFIAIMIILTVMTEVRIILYSRLEIGIARKFRDSSIAAVLFAFVVSTFGVMPIFSPELLERVDGSKSVVYVLESGDHDITVIVDESRKPLIIRQDEVKKRTLCAVGVVSDELFSAFSYETAYSLIFSDSVTGPDVPNCDRLLN